MQYFKIITMYILNIFLLIFFNFFFYISFNNKKIKNYIILIFLLTILFFGISFYWLKKYSISILIFFIFINYIIYLILGLFIFYLNKTKFKKIIFLIFPIIWIIIMYILKYFNNISFILEYSFSLKNLNSIYVFGSYFVTFILISFLILFYQLFNLIKSNYLSRKSKNKKQIILFIFIIIFYLIIIFYPYQIYQSQNSNYKNLNITLVQGNFNQDWMWRYNHSDLIFNTYFNLSKKVTNSDLIIWPEYAMPLDIFNERPDFAKKITNFSLIKNTTIITGQVLEKGKYHYDSASVFQKGKYLGTYNSIEPVIFNEQALNGKGLKVFKIPNKNLSFGIIICYEELNRDIFKEYKKLNVDFIVSLVNEQQIDNTIGKNILNEFVHLRAKEFKIPIIRSTNTGISEIIDKNGITLYQLKENTQYSKKKILKI